MNKLYVAITSLMFIFFSNLVFARTAPPTPVHTDEVAIHQVSQSLTLIAKLQSKQFVSIASEVSAKVIKINVEANQKVKKGQLLVELDASKASALLAEANAYLLDEKRKLKEYQLLVKKQAITQTEYNAQLATVKIADARLLAAQVLVDNHRITAPFSGTIGLVDFSEGKLVSIGETLLTLDNLSEMTLDLPVPERYLSMLNVGMEVTAVSRAWKKTTFTGYVKAVDSRVNPDTLNLRVRLLFDNQNHQLKPGMMLSTTLVFDAIDAPIIAVQALEYSGTKRFVYVLKEATKASKNKKSDSAKEGAVVQKSRAGKKQEGVNTKAYTVERRQVLLGARIGDQVLIESGLELGERIVVQGLVNMRDGLSVTDLSHTTTSIGKGAK